MPEEILSIYWRDRETIQNLGDLLTRAIVEAFGYQYLSYYDWLDRSDDRTDSHCLMIIGSMIDSTWLSATAIPPRIWGCGYWGDRRLRSHHLARADILAARGPLFARDWGYDVPLGDPALLIPELYSFRSHASGAIYVPHFHRPSAPDLSTLGVETWVDVRVKDGHWQSAVAQIAGADFVLTNSLHGAILAQAFEVPWAPCTPSREQLDKPVKWQDWYAYLGLDMSQPRVRTLSDGRRWWATVGSKGRVRSLAPILRVCPLVGDRLASLLDAMS